MKVSVVTLLALRSSSSVSSTIVLISCQSLSLDNGVFKRSICSIIFSNRSIYYSFFWVAVHARSYVTSSLFKIFLPHSNILK